MRYDLAAEQEYDRYKTNYGQNSLVNSAQVQNMLSQQLAQNEALMAEIHGSLVQQLSANTQAVVEAVNKPRNKTIIRDAEGKISGVQEI